ncbi:MAG: hypothetical protein V9G04_08340 [Nocardioides sp.]|jgi:hypothetical protein
MQLPNLRAPQVELAIKELAVDPADVDQDTYPVWIRLTRPLTVHERLALERIAPEERIEADAVVLHGVRLDDVAHDIVEWTRRIDHAGREGVRLETEAKVTSAEAQDRIREEHLNRSSDPGQFMH